MPNRTAQLPGISRLQGALAVVLATVVFALGLLSVSPTAHAHLHAGHDECHDTSSEPHTHSQPHDDAGCAVTLFQHGVTTPVDLPRVAAPLAAPVASVSPTRDTLELPAPPHLLRPARGPPSLG